jgi:hypothetical protein
MIEKKSNADALSRLPGSPSRLFLRDATSSAATDDQLELFFDWVPSVIDGCITFRATIIRGEARSSIEFQIDLNRLATAELVQLQNILSRRHAGIDNGVEVTKAFSWLLDLSLRQTTSLDLQARAAAVRQILLV